MSKLENKQITRMSKGELVSALEDRGFKKEALVDENGKKLKRDQLIKKLQDNEDQQEQEEIVVDIFDNAEVIDDEDDIGVEVINQLSADKDDVEDNGVVNDNDKTEKEEKVVSTPEDGVDEQKPAPNISDPGWTQYVIGLFEDDELEGQNPRVEGLRRIAELLIGEIIEEGCDLIAEPCEANSYRACVKAWIVFSTKDETLKRYEALADANEQNCFEDFATYLVAMADTRAKGRAYRNALRLRRVVAAEEVSKTMANIKDVQKGGHIHQGQITLIRMMSDKNNIPIEDVLKELGIECETNASNGEVILNRLSYEEALSVAKRIREIAEKEGE